MAGTFSTDVRIVNCPACGAPLQVSPAGGQTSCQFCRSQVQVPPHDDGAVRPVGPGLTEAERQQGLWTQAAAFRHQPLPPEVVQLLSAGPIDAGRIGPALQLWQGYCQGATAGDAAAAQWAVLLTGSISTYFANVGDQVRARALFETAMEALPAIADKQIMRCFLARMAVRAGEMDAANAWLNSCDPASPDLEADTAYRLTYAYLASAHGQWDAVVAALGPGPETVPVALPSQLQIDVIRANAVERRGDVNGAVAQLVYTARSHQGGAAALPQIVNANTALGLCPQSLPLAMNQLMG